MMSDKFSSTDDFAPRINEILASRLRESDVQVVCQGRRPAHQRNALKALLAGAAIALAGAVVDTSQWEGAPALGARFEMSDGRKITIVSGASDNARGFVHSLGKHYGADRSEAIAYWVAESAKTHNSPGVSVFIDDEDLCLVYQNTEITRPSERVHQMLDGLAEAPELVSASFELMSHSRLATHKGLLGPMGAVDPLRQRQQAFLHEIQHCHVSALARQVVERSQSLDAPAGALDRAGRLYQGLIVGINEAATMVQRAHPATDVQRLSDVAMSQVIESSADVFSILALYQGSDEAGKLLARTHLAHLVMFRDLAREYGSTHDAVMALLELDERIDDLLDELSESPQVIRWDDGGRVASFDAQAFVDLSSKALEFAVMVMDMPDARMQRMHYHEVMRKDGPWEAGVEAWERDREFLAVTRPDGGDAIMKMRERLIRASALTGPESGPGR